MQGSMFHSLTSEANPGQLKVAELLAQSSLQSMKHSEFSSLNLWILNVLYLLDGTHCLKMCRYKIVLSGSQRTCLYFKRKHLVHKAQRHSVRSENQGWTPWSMRSECGGTSQKRGVCVFLGLFQSYNFWKPAVIQHPLN